MNTLLNRSFVSVIFAQIASLFGDAVLRFALPLYVLNQTGSAALMGAVSACAWIPYIVLIFPTLVLVGLVKLIDEGLRPTA